MGKAFEVLIIHTLGTYRLTESIPAVCLYYMENAMLEQRKYD